MSLKFFQRRPTLRRLIFKLWLWDAQQKIRRITKYLRSGATILDVGCGPGSVCLLLKQRGFDVTPLDVADLSFSHEVRPVVYDGKRMPFAAGAFDIALLLTVLHHAAEPEAVIAEARRVARRIIIIEDVYRNRFQQRLTHFADSLVNLEFSGHPHHNKSDPEWRALFAVMGLKISDARRERFLLLFEQAIYCLD